MRCEISLVGLVCEVRLSVGTGEVLETYERGQSVKARQSSVSSKLPVYRREVDVDSEVDAIG
jgi:hypothetical protein